MASSNALLGRHRRELLLNPYRMLGLDRASGQAADGIDR
jgi:hypothetical protein